MCETSTRTPKSITPDTAPLQGLDLAPLWTYQVARAKSRELGCRLGREGAIVSHALLAIQEKGLIAWDAWVDDQNNEQHYRDDFTPEGAKTAPKYRPVADSRRLTDPDQILEYLGQGYTVAVGTPWKGGVQVSADGSFHWGGWSVGGHCYELVDYDLDADKVWIRNSWDNIPFGVSPDGTAWTSLASFMKQFSASTMNNGDCEAVVVADLDGFVSKIPSYLDAL
jgi:hypothetical protein